MRHLVTQTSITLGIAGDEGMVETEGGFDMDETKIFTGLFPLTIKVLYHV